MPKKTKISGTKQKGKVAKVMREYSKGDLKSGSGKKVTDKKQAAAIAYSEAKKAGRK